MKIALERFNLKGAPAGFLRDFDADPESKVTVYACQSCGALVAVGDGLARHNEWHNLLAKELRTELEPKA